MHENVQREAQKDYIQTSRRQALHRCKENRYIIVSDNVVAFLHADMNNNVHMLLEGAIAEMITNWTHIQETHMV